MRQNLWDRIKFQQRRYSKLNTLRDHVQNTVDATNRTMDEILKEQALLERTTVALQQAKPLLSASSIKQCESLANAAISQIFDLPYTVEYNVESCRFNLNKGDYKTDLADAEGGGLVTVISFVFTIYLLVKLNKRKFLAFDEAFTQVSSQYFQAFIDFINQLCKDFDVDILLISHDQRIQPDMCDRVYVVENGKTKRLK